MALVTFGLNHKTAPVELRERVAVSPDHVEKTLQKLLTLPAVNEAAVVSTCNRTEVYCYIEAQNIEQNPAIRWFLDQYQLHAEQDGQYVYQHLHENSIRHLLRVACGLDSMVLGEPQILGQLKTAYHTADNIGAVGRHLNKLFQYAFSVAKHIRTETEIGANPVSVAFAVVKLAKELFDDLSNTTALLIGAGETSELCAQHLASQHIGEIVVANRSVSKAVGLASRFSTRARGIGLSMLSEQLIYSDIVISSTASQLPLIGKGAVESALKKRKHNPLFLVDIAVPRDIEPEVGLLDDAYLYNIDDLQDFINHNLKSREESARKAETLIEQKVIEFIEWQREQNATQVIRQYREAAETLNHDMLRKAEQMLASGQSVEEVMRAITNIQKNKLLHMPTLLMRHLAQHNQLSSLQYVEELLRQKPKNK